jgi:hypothetical protein
MNDGRGRSRGSRETVRETVVAALDPVKWLLREFVPSDPAESPEEKRLLKPNSANGAAQESNLPSRGLHDLTGFEDESCWSWCFVSVSAAAGRLPLLTPPLRRGIGRHTHDHGARAIGTRTSFDDACRRR